MLLSASWWLRNGLPVLHPGTFFPMDHFAHSSILKNRVSFKPEFMDGDARGECLQSSLKTILLSYESLNKTKSSCSMCSMILWETLIDSV